MSSRLVKAFNVVAKSGPKVVSLPNYEQAGEESEVLDNVEQESIEVALELEITQQREKMHQELEEWKQSQQEHFLLQMEEEKRRGYQEGYQLGILDGQEHGHLQYKEQLQKANAILEQAYQEKKLVIQEAEPFVIALSVEIAKKILKQELQINREALLPMMKESLESVYETASLSISVAPDDFSFVQKQREQLLAVVNGKVEVKVVPDYSIQQGGCVIHTSSGSVDARIDVQLSEIKKALLSYQQEEHRE